jgi:hypothetical protein
MTWLDGGNPSIPRHAVGSWPKSPDPASREDWLKALKAFRNSLVGLERRAHKADPLANRGRDTRLRHRLAQ